MIICFEVYFNHIVQKIILFTHDPPTGGSKLIFFSPYKDGVNEENQCNNSGIKTENH